jgi:hypothetical protein
LKKELNLYHIIDNALDQTEYISDENVSDQPIEEDWFSRWRRNAEEVSDEKLRQIWAKMLAGEVQNPGMFSVSTINLLSLLGSIEAKLIEKYARSVIFGSSLINLEGDAVPVDDLCALTDIGFLSRYQGNLGLFRQASRAGNDQLRIIDCWNLAIVVETHNASDDLNVPVLNLSRAGIEILKLGTFRPDGERLKQTAMDLRRPGALMMSAKIARVGTALLLKVNGQSAIQFSSIEWL